MFPFLVAFLSLGFPQTESPLPPGVKAEWDLAKAFRERSATRERICLNGLWRWQPSRSADEPVPADQWGFYKVPGFWPAGNDYEREDTQTLFVHPGWKGEDLTHVSSAWYQREMVVPPDWSGRRITLFAEVVNSLAVVFLDGKKAGEIRFPAGEVDLTPNCKPGEKHLLSLLVAAMPLKAIMLSYSDTNAARQVKGTVARRGLCGDVFLVCSPAGARLGDVRIETSVRRGELTIDAELLALSGIEEYSLRVELHPAAGAGEGPRFASAPFHASDLKEGRASLIQKWKPESLWDINRPENLWTAEVSLQGPAGILDVALPIRFGFREFWIEGRDFYLNGTRIYLSALPIDNAQVGARTASYEVARESLRRLKTFGINFVYTHNYGCEPGTHLGFGEILRAADDLGMLVSFSQPHFGQYDWKAPNAEQTNGYARHAEYYVRVAQNHPSVVAYSMSHNATGYDEDMNPDLIDGLKDPRESWGKNSAKNALRAEAIVKRLDPGRVVYHHSSGNLGSMHTANFYTNFVPIQELCDWFEHWATQGGKPMFTVEYGVPFAWDWTQYRGWYKGERTWGSANVPWEFCLAEWDAQFLGDRAFRLSDLEKRNIRWEAGKFRTGSLWHRWDYPGPPGSAVFDDQQAVYSMYFTDPWRAFRTWGLSANSPWECESFWRLRPGVDRARKDFKVDWENLQRPGFSPDFTQRREAKMYLDYEWSDWIPLPAAQALLRNNRPLLAWIAGKSARFTSKDHVFVPGESFEKQLVLINNSRESVGCDAEWSLGLPQALGGRTRLTIPPGGQERVALRFDLPESLAPGTYLLDANARFSTGELQKDVFEIRVPGRSAPQIQAPRVALFDPKGESAKLLSGRVRFQTVEAASELGSYEILVIGKEALDQDGPGPDLSRVRDGLKVLVFEQTAKALEDRLGFRVAQYGLRQAYPRVPDHPLLAGLLAEDLRDWRGEATILPSKLQYEMRPRYGPSIKWCGMDVTQVWRCGCRGNVASVLIEKPARGDFMPVVEGGYGLQYSPLLEYREGKGVVVFCQMDVTDRTEVDPAASILVGNLIRYVSSWKPAPVRPLVYAGDPVGRRHLEAAGFTVLPYEKEGFPSDALLVVGPGGGPAAAGRPAASHVLAIGLSAADADAFKVQVRKAEHISSFFAAFGTGSALAGVGPSDVHCRDPRTTELLVGPEAIDDGVLGKAKAEDVVYCQLVPWQFDPAKPLNQKRSFRRAAALVTRLACNLGAQPSTPLLGRFSHPAGSAEKRWLQGLYLDVPEEWDDPYRFFRW